MQPYHYQPLPQQPQQQQPQAPPRYVYYYPGAPTMGGVPPQAAQAPQYQLQHYSHYPHPQPQLQPTAQAVPSSATATSASARMYPNLPPVAPSSSSLAVTVPLAQSQPPATTQSQQQQQQAPQSFDFEMMPTMEQIREEERQKKAEEEQEQQHEEHEEESHQDLVQDLAPKQETRPMQSTAPFQTQPQQPQTFVYPMNQYTMAPPQQPQLQPQQIPMGQPPMIAQQPQAQQCDRCQCHWRRSLWRHHHHNKHCQGCVFKAFLFLQLILAIIFCMLVPHWISFCHILLFIFGIVAAILQNIPCLIIFDVANVIPVWLSSMATVLMISPALHHNSGGLISFVLVLAICLVQWCSLVSGIHFTVRVIKRKRSECCNINNNNNNNPTPVPLPVQQPQQLGQPQHVVVNSMAPVNFPSFAAAQQSV